MSGKNSIEFIVSNENSKWNLNIYCCSSLAVLLWEVSAVWLARFGLLKPAEKSLFSCSMMISDFWGEGRERAFPEEQNIAKLNSVY